MEMAIYCRFGQSGVEHMSYFNILKAWQLQRDSSTFKLTTYGDGRNGKKIMLGVL